MEVDDLHNNQGYNPHLRWGHGMLSKTLEAHADMYYNTHMQIGYNGASWLGFAATQHCINVGLQPRRHSSESTPRLPSCELTALYLSWESFVPNPEMVAVPLDDSLTKRCHLGGMLCGDKTGSIS